MKKIIFSLFALSLFLSSQVFAASVPVKKPVFDYTKCSNTISTECANITDIAKKEECLQQYNNHCMSHAKRAKKAQAKCNALTDSSKKEDCLKEACDNMTGMWKDKCQKDLAEKDAKKAFDSENK